VNTTEALKLVTYLNRAGLLQVLEDQASVWADALDGVDVFDAVTAARALAKTQARWVTPGDIRAGVKVIRTKRIDAADHIDPPECIDPADTGRLIAWRREVNASVGAGMTTAQADIAACRLLRLTRRDAIAAPRPVPELVAQVASDAQATQARMAREYTAALTERSTAIATTRTTERATR